MNVMDIKEVLRYLQIIEFRLVGAIKTCSLGMRGFRHVLLIDGTNFNVF